MKRTRFTKRELELILEMSAIADASPPEGDYQEWAGKDDRPLERLREKLWSRLAWLSNVWAARPD